MADERQKDIVEVLSSFCVSGEEPVTYLNQDLRKGHPGVGPIRASREFLKQMQAAVADEN
jgi:hypothetical protein